MLFSVFISDLGILRQITFIICDGTCDGMARYRVIAVKVMEMGERALNDVKYSNCKIVIYINACVLHMVNVLESTATFISVSPHLHTS